jgi:hypothetical protein
MYTLSIAQLMPLTTARFVDQLIPIVLTHVVLLVGCAIITQFFYRVVQPGGARLHSKANVKSPLMDAVIAEGSIIEASDKFTPVGSAMTYVKCDIR